MLVSSLDGSLHVRTRGRSGQDGLAKLRRDGTRVFARPLPIDEIVETKRACSDREGLVWVLGRHQNPRGEPYSVVLRVSPDGGHVDEPIRDARLGGALDLVDFEQLAVTPDRTVVLAANHGRMQAVAVG